MLRPLGGVCLVTSKAPSNLFVCWDHVQYSDLHPLLKIELTHFITGFDPAVYDFGCAGAMLTYDPHDETEARVLTMRVLTMSLYL